MKLSAVFRTASSRSDMLSHTWYLAGQAHEQCTKPQLLLFADMLVCAAKYGAGPSDYLMFRFFELDNAERATYFTRVRSAAFVKRVNNRTDAAIFNDKNTFYEKFRDLMGRETFNLSNGSFAAFCTFMEGKTAIMAKPVDADCGRGIEKLYASDFESLDALWAYLKSEDKPFGIAEQVLEQHPDMALLHPHSVNCVRIATFIMDNGEPVVIYAACKAGVGGAPCDNTGRGGVTCRLDIEKGVTISHGHNEETGEFVTHPTSGIALRGFHIPMAAECKALALKAALRYPAFRYVGWDICITPSGPVLIEGNDYPGYDLAQMPDSDAPHPKVGLLTAFEKYGIEV